MTSIAEKKITIPEFLDIDFEEGYIYELINGEIMRRTSPNRDHQDVSMMLSTYFNNFILIHKLGKLYAAPMDVYLTEFDLVVPDLIFVSKNNEAIHRNELYIEGVPDLIVEILSKGTYKVDRGKKNNQYKKFGVKEYWVVNPRSKSIEVYEWVNGDYELISEAEETGEIESKVLAGFKLEIGDIFN
jgi:Uma2 family endonuclease